MNDFVSGSEQIMFVEVIQAFVANSLLQIGDEQIYMLSFYKPLWPIDYYWTTVYVIASLTNPIPCF